MLKRAKSDVPGANVGNSNQENQQRSRAEKQDAMIICQIAPLVKPPC